MRGVLVGSLTLIVLYTVLQPNAAKAAASGGNILVAGTRRLLSATVAGIPDRSAKATTKGSSTSTGTPRTTNL